MSIEVAASLRAVAGTREVQAEAGKDQCSVLWEIMTHMRQVCLSGRDKRALHEKIESKQRD
jgi:hypothetical protein